MLRFCYSYVTFLSRTAKDSEDHRPRSLVWIICMGLEEGIVAQISRCELGILILFVGEGHKVTPSLSDEITSLCIHAYLTFQYLSDFRQQGTLKLRILFVNP